MTGNVRPLMMVSRTLNALSERADRVGGVRKHDLDLGDRVIVRTRNSSYSIMSLGDGRYRVSGGWFDRLGVSPATTTINGCTWGGSAIKTDMVAGPGLFLEFGNRVVTTRIQQVRVVRSAGPSMIH